MIEPTKFVLFLGVSWALIIAPGPDLIYVITRGMAHGRRAGVLSAFGVTCGILIHTSAATFGITVILQTSAIAFLLVKYGGAAYLIYLGVRAWRDRSTFSLQASSPGVKANQLFWQGVLSNILNPKIAVFFLAFLPQFIDKDSGHVTFQMAILGLAFAFMGLCFLLVVGYSSGAFSGWRARRPHYPRFLQRLAGGILIGLGMRVAFADR